MMEDSMEPSLASDTSRNSWVYHRSTSFKLQVSRHFIFSLKYTKTKGIFENLFNQYSDQFNISVGTQTSQIKYFKNVRLSFNIICQYLQFYDRFKWQTLFDNLSLQNVFIFDNLLGRMIKPTNQIEIKPQRRSLRSSVKSSITNNQQTSARLNPINLAEQIIQCRICLQESQQSSKAFIKPCLCSGSVSFVHKECLQTWIKQRMNKATVEEQQRVIQKQAIECQMCKKDIPFCFEQKLKEINLRQIHSRIQAKPCVTLLLLTALLLVLFALGFVGVMMKDVGIDFKGPHQIESIILTISMVILPFFVLLIIYLFLDQFVFTYEFVISLPGEIIHSFEISMPQARNKNQGQGRNSKKESDTSQNLIRNSKINQQIHKPKVSGMLIQQLQ